MGADLVIVRVVAGSTARSAYTGGGRVVEQFAGDRDGQRERKQCPRTDRGRCHRLMGGVDDGHQHRDTQRDQPRRRLNPVLVAGCC